jgi:hypothetical protein
MQSVLGEFRKNRSQFPLEELRKHEGEWVAFSEDGRRIVASAQELDELATNVEAAGEELRNVWIEQIAFDYTDIFIGGAEQL